MRLWSGLLVAACATTVAYACESVPEVPAVHAAPMCSPFVTPSECQAHHRILSMLTELRERNAYLSMYTMLITERQALCGPPGERKPNGLLSLNQRHP